MCSSYTSSINWLLLRKGNWSGSSFFDFLECGCHIVWHCESGLMGRMHNMLLGLLWVSGILCPFLCDHPSESPNLTKSGVCDYCPVRYGDRKWTPMHTCAGSFPKVREVFIWMGIVTTVLMLCLLSIYTLIYTIYISKPNLLGGGRSLAKGVT